MILLDPERRRLVVSSSVGGTLWPLISALRELPCLASVQDRVLVVRLLTDHLGHLPIEESPRIEQHLINIVEVLQRRSDGLPTLIEVLGVLDGGTIYLPEVRRIVAERDADEMWPEAERARLFGLLSGMIFKDLVELYHQVAGINAPELPAETTYREVFLTLETLNADATGLPKPIVFVEHLAEGRRPELSTELRRWSDRQASRLELITELQALRRAFRAPPPGPAPNEPAYLVLMLRQVGLAGEAFQLCHWTQIDLSEGWHPERGDDFFGALDDVKRQVAVLIEEVETKWARYQPDIRIEVVLSGELLNLDVDQWSWEVESALPVPIGCRYSFAIRSLERMQTGKWHRSWHARWTVLNGQLQQYGGVDPESVRRGEGGDDIRRLVADFEINPKLVSLTLSAPPDGSENGGGEVAVGLRAGVPVMVWHREDCDSEEFLAAARELLHGDGPGTVLQRIKQVRTTAYQSHADHVGHRLALMWDDPHRLVVPPDLGPPREASVA